MATRVNAFLWNVSIIITAAVLLAWGIVGVISGE